MIAGLIDVIRWLEEVFERLQLRRSYGGAIAYNFHAPPRFTQDVDVLALVPDATIPGLVEEFQSAGCRHLAPEPRPIELEPILRDLRSKAHLAAFACQGIRTELFLPWHPFHHKVLERSPQRELDGLSIRIHAPEDLIVFKKIFDRPKDIMDIKAILLAQSERLNLVQLKNDARQLLTDESYAELESLTANDG